LRVDGFLVGILSPAVFWVFFLVLFVFLNRRDSGTALEFFSQSFTFSPFYQGTSPGPNVPKNPLVGDLKHTLLYGILSVH